LGSGGNAFARAGPFAGVQVVFNDLSYEVPMVLVRRVVHGWVRPERQVGFEECSESIVEKYQRFRERESGSGAFAAMGGSQVLPGMAKRRRLRGVF
jgi:hypothetical protein